MKVYFENLLKLMFTLIFKAKKQQLKIGMSYYRKQVFGSYVF